MDEVREGMSPEGASPPEMDGLAFSPLSREELEQMVRAAHKAGAGVDVRDQYGWTPLMAAADRADLELLRALLDAGADVNARDGGNNTVLMRAIDAPDNLEIIKLLLDAGADLAAMNDIGMTALIWAIEWEDPDAVKALIEAGAEVNVKNGYGWTPLAHALANSASPELLQILLDAGADPGEVDPNARDHLGRTALMRAFHESVSELAPEVKLERVAGLIRSGTDVNAKDDHGWTPLAHALANSASPELRQILLDAGADPDGVNPNARDEVGMTVLMQALDLRGSELDPETHLERVAGLIRSGADVNAGQERTGTTPLMRALWGGAAPEVVQLLLDAGADVNARDHDGETPLMHVQHAKGEYAARLVKLLLAVGGVEVNARDKMGWTPLMHVIAGGHSPDVIQMLIDAGADPEAVEPNAWDTVGQTLLMCAVMRSDLDMISWLIRSGADVNAKDNSGTPTLMYAGYRDDDNAEVVAELLKAGADVNAQDSEGCTALMNAVFYSCPRILKALLEAGADPAIRDNEGKTARDHAMEEGVGPEILAMLTKGPA